ncbi:hypothetical protein CXF68_12585 [Tenacibaculum sp. Bg11-29]|nr:hypothetical protein CXF68_12585 [Tenacibaculum sp. Bg11-29]
MGTSLTAQNAKKRQSIKKATKQLSNTSNHKIEQFGCISPKLKKVTLLCKRRTGFNNSSQTSLISLQKCTKEDLILKIDNTPSNPLLALQEWTKFSITISRKVSPSHWEGVTSSFINMSPVVNNVNINVANISLYTTLYSPVTNNNLLYFNLYNDPILKTFLDSFFSSNYDNDLRISVKAYHNNIEKCAKIMEVSPFYLYQISNKYKQGGLLEYSKEAKEKF